MMGYDLPSDCIFNIFKFSSPLDLCQACQVNKEWNELAENDFLWEHHCQQRWHLWDTTPFQPPYKGVYRNRSLQDRDAVLLAHQSGDSRNPVQQRRAVQEMAGKGMEVLERLVSYVKSLPRHEYLTLKHYTRKALCKLNIPFLKRQLAEMYRDQFNFEDAAILVAKSTDPLLDIKTSILDIFDEIAAEIMNRFQNHQNNNNNNNNNNQNNQNTQNNHLNMNDKISIVLDYLFHDLRFEGDTATYYDPRNSMINEVLRRRQGMPITLCVIFEAVCRRVGIHGVHMTGMPMNFMCHYTDPETGEDVFLDLFRNAISMSRQDCIDMMTQMQVEDPHAPEHLAAVDPDHVLSRMLINTINCYLRSASQVMDMMAPMDLYIHINDAHIHPGQRLLRVEALIAAEEPGNALEELDAIYREVRPQNVMRVGEMLRHRAQEMWNTFLEQDNSNDPLSQFPSKSRNDNTTLKYHVGQIMRHRIYPYRGVIYGWDEHCQASHAWQQQMGVRSSDEPFYNVYVHMDDRYYQCTYVAESNITIESPNHDSGPVDHPNMGEHFDAYDTERNIYIPNMLTKYMYPDDRFCT